MLESLFEFLFKYRLLLFQQGDVAFRASWLGLLALVPAAVAGYLIFRTYANVRGNSRRLDRTMLTAIRLGIRLPPKSPNLNAYAERFVRSIKEECLTRVVPLGERHVRRLVYEYIEHYHRERNHQGLDNQLLQRPHRRFGRWCMVVPHGWARCRLASCTAGGTQSSDEVAGPSQVQNQVPRSQLGVL